MLHCPPSRIHLTSADINEFEQRFTAQQNGRYIPLRTASLRLGSGAGHLTRASIVPAHQNLGRARADSCTSEAKLCIEAEDAPSSPAIPTIVTSAASPLGNLSHRRSTLSPSLPHIPERVTSLSGERGAIAERALRQKSTRPSSIPRPLRRPSQQAPIPVFEQPPEFNEYFERLHRSRTGPETWDGQRLTPSHSELLLSAASTHHARPLFDPDAAVFVPRTRFGSTTSASVEGPVGSISDDAWPDAARIHEETGNLRLQSAFERNSQLPRPPVHASTDSAGQVRRRSRTHDQNTTVSTSALNADRIHAARPPSFTARRGSGSQRPVIFPRRESSRRNIATFERSRRGSNATSAISVRSSLNTSMLNVPRDIDSGRQMPRSISPALSTSSRSTPNLLRAPSPAVTDIHTRSNSFTSSHQSDREVDAAVPYSHLEPESCIPDAQPAIAQLLDLEPGSALDQLFSNRNSPLDELTQQLSRMSSGRPRSVGRSFECPPGTRQRISLLNGDPFRQDLSPERQQSSDDYEGYQTFHSLQSATRKSKRDSILSTLSTDEVLEDPVALSLALPSPALPLATNTPVQFPSTPATALRERVVSPRSSASISSPVRGSEWMSSGTPPTMSQPTSTPRMTVYNDSRPAELQPQTPADVARSTARRRARAGTASSHGSRVSNTYNGSPLVGGSSGSSRHTYPAANATPNLETPVRRPAVHERRSTGRRSIVSTLAARVDEEENDVEAGLDELEGDRMVWSGRREAGYSALDITPPAEGRFERYLE